MSIEKELENIITITEQVFGVDWKTICSTKKRQYTCVKYLLSLYLFNLGYRHRAISKIINCDRTHMYYIIEKATDIMRSEDPYFVKIKNNIKNVFELSGTDWMVMKKFL